MLTLTDMISMIQFRLGRRKDLAAEIEREITLAQTRLEDSPILEPWFLVQTDPVAVTQGSHTVPLPLLFIRESEEEQMQVEVGGIKFPIARASLDDVRAEFQGATGRPQAYVLYGETLEVYPLPDKDYTIEYTYAKRGVSLVSTDPTDPPDPLFVPTLSNVWTDNAYPLLMNKALIILAMAIGHKEALANATNDFNTAFAEMQTRSVQREDSNRNYS